MYWKPESVGASCLIFKALPVFSKTFALLRSTAKFLLLLLISVSGARNRMSSALGAFILLWYIVLQITYIISCHKLRTTLITIGPFRNNSVINSYCYRTAGVDSFPFFSSPPHTHANTLMLEKRTLLPGWEPRYHRVSLLARVNRILLHICWSLR